MSDLFFLLPAACAGAAIVFTKQPYSQDALHGRSAILRCEVEDPAGVQFEWMHNGVRIKDTERRYQEGSSLTFTAVDRRLDGGIFQCVAKRSATGEEERSTNASFNIKWIESGGVTLLNPASVDDIQTSSVVTLRCHIDGHPRPNCHWFRDGKSLSDDGLSILLNNKERTLTLSSAEPDDNGEYYCCARNAGGSVCSNQNFTLSIIDLEDMRPFSPQVLIADTVQRIACVPPRGSPTPVVWWERNGQRIPKMDRVYQDGVELIFSPITEKDAGTYTCHAANRAGERKQDLQITVATAPEWLEKPPLDSWMEEGKSGFLHCLTKASVEPVVSWSRNSVPISKDSRFEIFPNGTLKILSVEVYDGTVYKCESSTPAGSIVAQARVHVQEKLKFTPPPQPHQCMELDKEVTVHCSATGREKPAVQWVKADGTSLPPHVDSDSGLLHFQRVTQKDAGNYTCIASNSQQGEIQADVLLTVAVYINFKIVPENTTMYQGHTAILHCQASGNPTPLIQWRGKERMLDSTKANPRIQIMPNGSLVIYHVTSEDSGKYTCIAGNVCDIKHRDTFLYVVDKPLDEKSEQEASNPYKMIQTIGLSVGAAVAYIIIVLGLMFYCKKRRKAKRRSKNEGEEPEMECLNGGAVLQNGQTTAEIQEEVPLTTLGNKRLSSGDKINFPRANLHPITTLGRGVFGEVFLAKAQGLDSVAGEAVVLVKTLQTRDEQLQMDFRREMDMFSKLNHANVVRLLGLCREAEPHYMILEYVDLGDLKQFLRISKSKDENSSKSHHLSSKHKVFICSQVALGMEHLSNSRFVHKDLAARNCLVSAQRMVKICALGLSKDVYNSEYYHLRQAWVPLRWMPPEAVQEDDFSTKSDVWSFGVLMWEVYTRGELPYPTLPDDEVLAGLQNGSLKLPAPEGCSSRIYKLMQRCWATSPKDRPSFSDIVNTLGDAPSNSKLDGELYLDSLAVEAVFCDDGPCSTSAVKTPANGQEVLVIPECPRVGLVVSQLMVVSWACVKKEDRPL
ncbi:inactive tyrosine-protein kinase 7 [Rhinophrynus dorsalis]